MSIELVGYKTIFENLVYSRDISLHDENGILVPTRAVVIAKRSAQATKNRVVEYLQEKAREVSGHIDGNTLEGFLSRLPEKFLADLRDGTQECLDFVRKNTKAPELKDGQQPDRYVHLRYGFIPAQTKEVDTEDLKDPKGYDKNLLERWVLKFLLDSKGNLPDKTDFPILLKHNIQSSDTLTVVSAKKYSAEEVINVINAFYSAFTTPEHINLLVDTPDPLLRTHALEPVAALFAKISMINHPQ